MSHIGSFSVSGLSCEQTIHEEAQLSAAELPQGRHCTVLRQVDRSTQAAEVLILLRSKETPTPIPRTPVLAESILGRSTIIRDKCAAGEAPVC